MPIYEYACNQCSAHFEKLVPRLEAEVSCPSCESTNARRLPSVFSSPGATPAPQHGCGGGCQCFPSN